MKVDLNCDLGECSASDAELMPLISSASVCCGVHAGDEAVSRATLRLARDHGVAVGAHPGYADRDHFGRRELNLDDGGLFALIVEQVSALRSWAGEIGVEMSYIKPHGALYNQACRDERVARLVVAAAEHLGLPLLGLPDCRLEEISRGRVAYFREGFADRRYRSDGSLVPRTESNAMVTDVVEAVEQAQRLVAERGVQSLCVHGDHPDAVTFVRELRRAFVDAGLTIAAFV